MPTFLIALVAAIAGGGWWYEKKKGESSAPPSQAAGTLLPTGPKDTINQIIVPGTNMLAVLLKPGQMGLLTVPSLSTLQTANTVNLMTSSAGGSVNSGTVNEVTSSNPAVMVGMSGDAAMGGVQLDPPNMPGTAVLTVKWTDPGGQAQTSLINITAT